jgi:predicted amidohydrolase
MAFLPEGFDYIAESKEDSVTLAEDLNGDTISAYRSIAHENGIALSLGGFHCKSSVVGKTWNTHVVIDERGQLSATYQKCHLFDVDIPEKNIRFVFQYTHGFLVGLFTRPILKFVAFFVKTGCFVWTCKLSIIL